MKDVAVDSGDAGGHAAVGEQLGLPLPGALGIFSTLADFSRAGEWKRTATGTQFTLRNIVDFNDDSNVGDLYKRGA